MSCLLRVRPGDDPEPEKRIIIRARRLLVQGEKLLSLAYEGS